MYAVIETGGKQQRVTVGQCLKIEKLDVEAGAAVDFDKVLLVGEGENIKLGQPYVANGKVSAKVLAHGRGKKINIVKFKRRKHHLKRQGHRQDFTQVEITDIKS
ncbi:MAG: 50S ribosomal protein L21 [Pseudomonadota bacterium]